MDITKFFKGHIDQSISQNWETAGQTDKVKLPLWVYLQVGRFLGAKASAGPFPLIGTTKMSLSTTGSWVY